MLIYLSVCLSISLVFFCPLFHGKCLADRATCPLDLQYENLSDDSAGSVLEMVDRGHVESNGLQWAGPGQTGAGMGLGWVGPEHVVLNLIEVPTLAIFRVTAASLFLYLRFAFPLCFGLLSPHYVLQNNLQRPVLSVISVCIAFGIGSHFCRADRSLFVNIIILPIIS